MKIGIIYVGFNTEDMIASSLAPWVEARESQLDGHEYIIAAVSVPFEGFDVGEKDNTQLALQHCKNAGHIDHLIAGEAPVKETEARSDVLRWLMVKGCDLTWMIDSDENYTIEEISRIMAFINARPMVAAFKGSFKNYVFDDKTYLTEPFQPMRIHRLRHNNYLAESFWDDNNVLYRGTLTRNFTRDIDLPIAQIPRSVAFVKHITWLSNLRSKKKIEYQKARNWPNCSFVWDDAQGGLIWNPVLPIPETAKDL